MQSWVSYSLVVSAIFLSTLLLAAPFIIRFAGQTVGWYLRRKTSSRRELILARVEVEEDDHRSKQRHSPKSEDEGWERIENNGGSAESTEDKANAEWKGVIGFFHPFWYYTASLCAFQYDQSNPRRQ